MTIEPPCTRSTPCRPHIGRVSWPADLIIRDGHASASTYVCANPGHQNLAADWVESVTGHRGQFVPFPVRVGGAA